MKLLKHIIRAGALCGLLLTTAAAKAQTVQLKVLDWNVLSFEMTDKSNQIDFIVDEYVDLIKAQNPDIVCINELETGTSRMGKEKLTELASRLDMYPYFIMSYPKDVGFYGNGILSKYPIVSSFSALHPYKHAKGEGNYQWNTGYEYYLYGLHRHSGTDLRFGRTDRAHYLYAFRPLRNRSGHPTAGTKCCNTSRAEQSRIPDNPDGRLERRMGNKRAS